MTPRRLVVGCAVVLAGCQDNISTPFPPGLEPLEDNVVPDASGPPTEELRSVSKDGEPIRVFGRGFVFADPGTVWALTKQPTAMFARCSTDVQTVTPDNDLAYEFSFLVHYVVNDILTVEWDDQWRYGVVEGTPEAPVLGMIRHQKTQGSDFITTSEGTVQVLGTDDPGITELAFVERLDALSGSPADVLQGMQDNYDRLLALAHGSSDTSCP